MKFSLSLSAFVTSALLIASYFTGFFKLPKLEKRDPLTWINVLIAFACYFFGMLISSLLTLFLPISNVIESLTFGLFGIIPLFFILSYYRTLPRNSKKAIFWNLPIKPKKKIFVSIKSTLVSTLWSLMLLLPSAVMFGHLIQKTIHYAFSKTNFKEQHAITMFKRISGTGTPILLITVSLVIPFTEELLFRGFLQSRLRCYGRTFAIITTSVFFSGIHFSKDHADGNFVLIPYLFMVSVFLGFLYEKEKNLIAPYLTHMLFNLSQALLITL